MSLSFDRLSPIQQCTFINHHVAAGCKVILLGSAAYPFLAVAFGSATLKPPMIPHHHHMPPMGTSSLCDDRYSAPCTPYIFELFLRRKISPISAAHHTRAIVITQSAMAISLNFQHEKDATYEFVLRFVWGTLSIMCLCSV
ncbi:uncharacterized protein PV06_10898 [Exophiala oligosperma]|uniref:Uncharacterized protein n=1 Tax=Exophiala oligosperma TaxID=215243 RepID=A0A0D2D3Y6_9EURO|nr:uncharacterized protein PV06_10898 [Exophiala oligosperma]KIW37000.1 hypothetical protein PV06_10898 [Exophiala oligosperma]